MSNEALQLCNVQQGHYVYREDLLRMEMNSSKSISQLPARAMALSSTLRTTEWKSQLTTFPDPCFYHFILRGLSNGFRIGFDSSQACQPAKQNMRLAYEHPDVVKKYLEREVLFQRMFQLTTEETAAEPRIQVSPFGVIPKRGKEGKWRLIVDLSTPSGRSVNDGLTQDVCSISYTSVDIAVKLIQSMGLGTLMAKMDLKEAYRNIPVHPADHHLLAVQWNGLAPPSWMVHSHLACGLPPNSSQRWQMACYGYSSTTAYSQLYINWMIFPGTAR